MKAGTAKKKIHGSGEAGSRRVGARRRRCEPGEKPRPFFLSFSFSFHPGVGSALTVGMVARSPAAEALIPPSLLGSGALATCPTETLPAPWPKAALVAVLAAAPRPAPEPTAISAPVAESGTRLKASLGANAAIPALTGEPLGAAAFGSLI